MTRIAPRLGRLAAALLFTLVAATPARASYGAPEFIVAIARGVQDLRDAMAGWHAAALDAPRVGEARIVFFAMNGRWSRWHRPFVVCVEPEDDREELIESVQLVPADVVLTLSSGQRVRSSSQAVGPPCPGTSSRDDIDWTALKWRTHSLFLPVEPGQRAFSYRAGLGSDMAGIYLSFDMLPPDGRSGFRLELGSLTIDGAVKAIPPIRFRGTQGSRQPERVMSNPEDAAAPAYWEPGGLEWPPTETESSRKVGQSGLASHIDDLLPRGMSGSAARAALEGAGYRCAARRRTVLFFEHVEKVRPFDVTDLSCTKPADAKSLCNEFRVDVHLLVARDYPSEAVFDADFAAATLPYEPASSHCVMR